MANYYSFFGILAPVIGNSSGSIRANMGLFFFFTPILILTAVQTLYVSSLMHLVARAFYAEKRDFLNALFVLSVVILLYSVFCTIFPAWGAYPSL